MTSRNFSISVSLLLVTSAAEIANAQVIEPNGFQAPNLTLTNGETSLQEYFDGQGETIDALAEASAEPGAFSPLCEFTAELVMSESMGTCGLSWYNVPDDPNVVPTALFPIVPEANMATGQVFSGTDIRMSPDFAGGLVGFALTQNGGVPIYYSEYQRNANCTGCIEPGHWKMMLAYQSGVLRNTYYLGFEDWGGADEASWYDNDGDFQDKLFRVTGVTCPGGGEPCDTGEAGLCATGLTECSFDGQAECIPQYEPEAERCDNVDNDCSGSVDDGDLCEPEQVCVRGECVGRCSTGEFSCPMPLVCGNDGYCVEAACKDVDCGPGLACREGECVGPCAGVICPIGQVCRSDRCVDPCLGVVCEAQTFCNRGVCLGDCQCSGCPGDEECGMDGRCATPGCADVSCPAGQGCRNGACVPACDGAVCPGAAACVDGTCAEPVVGTAGMGGAGNAGSAGSAGTVPIVVTGGGSSGGSSGSSSSAGTAGAAGSLGGAGAGGTASGAAGEPLGGGAQAPAAASGCACRAAGSRRSSPLGLLATLGAALLLTRLRARKPRTVSLAA
jgi:hypothetical protein